MIIRALLIVFIVSLGLAFSLKSFLGFAEIFVIATLVQFLTAFIWKSHHIKSDTDNINNIINDFNETLERSIATITCPCGNKVENVAIFVNEDLIIRCDKCDNDFKVSCSVSTQLITEPLSLEVVYDKLKQEIDSRKDKESQGTEL
jgi:hypothetical protein